MQTIDVESMPRCFRLLLNIRFHILPLAVFIRQPGSKYAMANLAFSLRVGGYRPYAANV